MPSPKRILVVDDDDDIARLLESKLSNLGYDVCVHGQARGALDAAKRFNADLAILDVMLGDGIGYQVARAIRQDPLLYRIPVLFQSVLNEKREVDHAYTEGGDGYLTKPYSLDRLVDSLSRMSRLAEELELRCPLTGLHSLVHLRREIDHHLFRDEPFALFYVIMDGLTSFHHKVDRVQIEQISRTIGQAIKQTIENAGFYETTPCHLGGGYFMVLTKLDDRKRFRSPVPCKANVQNQTVKTILKVRNFESRANF